jgi:serine-type D-Ala-D-Ala carboxypeptidase/endopeptidase (penicillin-binding protein 4)
VQRIFVVLRGGTASQKPSRFAERRLSSWGLCGLGIVALWFLACRREPQKDAPCAPASGSASPADGATQASRATPESDFEVVPDEETAPQALGHGASGLAPNSDDVGAGALVELEAWARKHGGHARGLARDLQTGKTLFELEAGVPVNPASTQKLLTAGAALSLLGPAFRFKTELWIERDQGQKATRVTLVGGGAPDFKLTDLREWALELAPAGVHALSEIVVDQSLFSGSAWPPAYEEQPNEWASFRAPVSALALERNAITLHVVPAATPDGRSAVWLSPPGLSTIEGDVKTGDKQSGDRVRWQLSPSASRPGLVSEVGGSLAVDASPRSYTRRLDDPSLAAGLAFRALLPGLDPKQETKVTLAKLAASGAERLFLERSAPLATLVRELGKDSDNFTAEMLAIALSAAEPDSPKGKAWSTTSGMTVLRGWLEKLGLNLQGVVLRNGSGLFGANKVSCELIVGVLGEMARGSALAPEYLSQLAIGGVDGTLRGRFGGAAWAARVRAKTGTLRDTDALSGYLYPPDAGFPIAFSIVVSGVNGQHAEARRRIDRVVQALAQAQAAKVAKGSARPD